MIGYVARSFQSTFLQREEGPPMLEEKNLVVDDITTHFNE